jgi:hypothetical protein
VRRVAITTLIALAALAAQARAQDVAFAAGDHDVASAFFPSVDPRLELAFTPSSADADAAAALPLPSYGRWVGITKWVTLGAAVGLGTLGFTLSNKADDSFTRLEFLCDADPDNCRERNADGSYADPRLESLYQDVVRKDQQARLSLIGAQVSFGASVLLFIVDFQKGKGPGDVPYEPEPEKSALELSAVPGEITVRYYLR